jgi:hypothetical protein
MFARPQIREYNPDLLQNLLGSKAGRLACLQFGQKGFKSGYRACILSVTLCGGQAENHRIERSRMELQPEARSSMSDAYDAGAPTSLGLLGNTLGNDRSFQARSSHRELISL